MDAEISIAEKHHVHFSRSDELPRKDRRRVAAEEDLDVGRRAAHRLGDLEPSVERVPPFACNSDIPRLFVLEDCRDIVVESGARRHSDAGLDSRLTEAGCKPQHRRVEHVIDASSGARRVDENDVRHGARLRRADCRARKGSSAAFHPGQ